MYFPYTGDNYFYAAVIYTGKMAAVERRNIPADRGRVHDNSVFSHPVLSRDVGSRKSATLATGIGRNNSSYQKDASEGSVPGKQTYN